MNCPSTPPRRRRSRGAAQESTVGSGGQASPIHYAYAMPTSTAQERRPMHSLILPWRNIWQALRSLAEGCALVLMKAEGVTWRPRHQGTSCAETPGRHQGESTRQLRCQIATRATSERIWKYRIPRTKDSVHQRSEPRVVDRDRTLCRLGRVRDDHASHTSRAHLCFAFTSQPVRR